MTNQTPWHSHPHQNQPPIPAAQPAADIIIRQPDRSILRTTNPDADAGITDIVAIAAPATGTARMRWHTPSVDHKRRMAVTPAVRTCGWASGDTLRLEWHAPDTFTLTRTTADEVDSVFTTTVTIDANNRIQLPAAAIANLGLGDADRPLVGIPKDGAGTITVIAPAAFERITFGAATIQHAEAS